MLVIDYLGFRLLATSLLPIDNSSIVYGSADGGNTLHTHTDAAKHMKMVASVLNLQSHVVQAADGAQVEMHGPGDIEVHVSPVDGRLYALDFARLFPAEPPQSDGSQKLSYLVKLMRPELVRDNPVPLSSDAFSCFGRVDAVRAVVPCYLPQ
jgi:hypothetical protein